MDKKKLKGVPPSIAEMNLALYGKMDPDMPDGDPAALRKLFESARPEMDKIRKQFGSVIITGTGGGDPGWAERHFLNIKKKLNADAERLFYTAPHGSYLHQIWHPELYNALGGFVEPNPMNYLSMNVNFGHAVEAMKNGYCVARQGWNGKNMYVFLNKGSKHFLAGRDLPQQVESIRTDLFENGAEGTSTRLPNINMMAATGSVVTGWLASQTDILAEDWCVLEPGASQG